MRHRILPFLLLTLGTGCSSPAADDVVRVRLHNLSPVDYDSVIVGFPQHTERYGALAAGALSYYAEVTRAYRYAYIEVWIGGEKFVLQPIDFVGESLLPAGRHTYGINFGGEPPQLHIVMADQYRQQRPAGTLFFTAARPATDVMEALFQGRVVRDQAGCVRLDTPDRHTVIWPHGFTLASQDGQLAVRDAGGRTIGRIGGEFRFGGGEVGGLADNLLVPEQRARAGSYCPGRYWIVGDT